MKFIMDFKTDWHEILKEIMRNEWGMDTKGLTTDIPVHFFNAVQRRITARRRTLLISDTFQCPAEHQAGWDFIRQKVTDGQDLAPHLSKLINNPEETDPMLNDWGGVPLTSRHRYPKWLCTSHGHSALCQGYGWAFLCNRCLQPWSLDRERSRRNSPSQLAGISRALGCTRSKGGHG